MRNTLEKLKGKFIKVNAVVVKYSWENQDFGKGLKTLLLCHVRDSKGHYLTSHTWVRASNHFTDADLSQGDVVEFTAQVMWYKTPTKEDYGFTAIKNVQKICSKSKTRIQNLKCGSKKNTYVGKLTGLPEGQLAIPAL